jgi:hypothetical protein
MAVNIDELNVETQHPSAAPAASSKGEAPQPERDLKSEMEALRERALRLQAD